MEIVKKWAGCVVAFVAGLLGLVLSATSGMVRKTPLGSSSTKAFKVITDSDLMEQAELFKIKSDFVTLKIFAIVTLIVSVLLLVYAVVALLNNLKVINLNSKILELSSLVLVVLLLVSTIGLLVASNNYANEMFNVVKYMGVTKVSVGVYQPVMLVVSIITTVASAVFAFLKRKSA